MTNLEAVKTAVTERGSEGTSSTGGTSPVGRGAIVEVDNSTGRGGESTDGSGRKPMACIRHMHEFLRCHKLNAGSVRREKKKWVQEIEVEEKKIKQNK